MKRKINRWFEHNDMALSWIKWIEKWVFDYLWWRIPLKSILRCFYFIFCLQFFIDFNFYGFFFFYYSLLVLIRSSSHNQIEFVVEHILDIYTTYTSSVRQSNFFFLNHFIYFCSISPRLWQCRARSAHFSTLKLHHCRLDFEFCSCASFQTRFQYFFFHAP